MTDFEISYAVMAVLYLMESCVLIPENTVLFTRPFRHWKMTRSPGCSFGKQRLALICPLPWAAEWHIAPSPDASFTELGVITLNSLHDYPRGLPRPRVLPNGTPEAVPYLEVFAAAGYPAGKQRVVLPFEGTSPARKQAPDPGLLQWTDPRPARKCLALLRGPLFLLKLLCSLQWCWAFAGAPLLLSFFSPQGMILPYLFILYWLSGAIATAFAFARRRQGQSGWLAFCKALWLFLYPLAAMRAVQIACAKVLPPCHESAVAEALMNSGKSGRDSPAGISRTGADYLADLSAQLRHKLFCRSLTARESAALGKANARLLQAVCANWKTDTLPPSPHKGTDMRDAVCACPVCGVALATSMDYCPHCLEVKTIPLD